VRQTQWAHQVPRIIFADDPEAEHFLRINDDIRSLKVADFAPVIRSNANVQSLLGGVELFDGQG